MPTTLPGLQSSHAPRFRFTPRPQARLESNTTNHASARRTAARRRSGAVPLARATRRSTAVFWRLLAGVPHALMPPPACSPCTAPCPHGKCPSSAPQCTSPPHAQHCNGWTGARFATASQLSRARPTQNLRGPPLRPRRRVTAPCSAAASTVLARAARVYRLAPTLQRCAARAPPLVDGGCTCCCFGL